MEAPDVGDFRDQESTERRYLARQLAREASQRRLAAGGVLDGDSPKRVRKRLQRLGLEEVARAKESGRGPQDEVDLDFERFVGRMQAVPVHFLERGLVAARAVGLVRLEDGEDLEVTTNRFRAGTGILISSRLFLTARELIPDHGTAERSSVAFQFQEDSEGRRESPIVFDFDPDCFLYTHLGLGFTVVALHEQSRTGEDLTSLGACSLIRDEGKVVIGERLNRIDHPDGGPKQISLRDAFLVDVLPEHLHYQGAQATGALGAPVFNDQWEIVAIHTGGIARRDSRGRILDRDGRPWFEEQGELGIDWVMGEGVRISRIARLLRRQSWPTEQRRLCAEVFEPALHPPWTWAPLRTVPNPSSAPSMEYERLVPTVPGQLRGSSPTDDSGVELDRGGGPEEVIWTVPVRIRLRVDPPQFHAPHAEPVGSSLGVTPRGTECNWPGRGEVRSQMAGETIEIETNSRGDSQILRQSSSSPKHRRSAHLSSTDQ